MKVLLVILLCIAAALAVDHATTQKFIEFQHTYGRFYPSAEEYHYRLAVFHSNVVHASKLQRMSNETKYGITKFMDMTPEEFHSTILMSKLPAKAPGVYVKQNFTEKAPASFDWRTRSPPVVTPVYNQGQCGSCWAFSATENIESTWALAGHPLTSLSQQQIVSCDTLDYGCEGGWPYNAYKYIIGANGQESYSAYPYSSGNGDTGSCNYQAKDIVAKIDSWSYVTESQNEGEMANYLAAKGPLSICVDAETWQYYTGGVLMANTCSTSIDHCVEAIGYDMSAPTPYWIVRNSWGTDWGLSGYLWLQYGKDTCALAQVVTMSHAK